MGRQLVPLTAATLPDLPADCRSCVFWELDPVRGAAAERAGRQSTEKASWITAVTLDWGPCGWVAQVDGSPAGYILYAPPAYVPRSGGFPTGPVSSDAVQLITGRVEPGYENEGLGRMLVQSMARDLLLREVRAIEVFGDERWQRSACMLPTGHLRAVGFEVVRPHPAVPRLRMELKSTVTWRADVELALDRLFGRKGPAPALGAS
ncbi:GNAT family N-acetyltransferase [Streptomyces sp. ACA25]|uniref:GNAT family N-acetyltransferase n=1 Tax=Streptomyces sp. ACA25 TaxID=3022596 RepID=UPI002307E239|nr:GNAT family N-acetyltransferase [Streptomyces sp. ACA25]MDB1086251.1 GNAT family N-acetyltransferase [Streptomyces sp. ACA25]